MIVAEQTPCKLNNTQGYNARLRHQQQRLQMSYKHLSLEERHYIEISLRNEESHEIIAESLDRSQSSITREIARNTGLRGYLHKQAHKKTIERHQRKFKAVKVTNEVKIQSVIYLQRTGVQNKYLAGVLAFRSQFDHL